MMAVFSHGSHRTLRYASVLVGCIFLSVVESADAQSNSNPFIEGRGGDLFFPVSCGAQIQPRFDAALAALHSFWYGRAREEFTAIAQTDPDCAMAHWGLAMSVWNQLWAPPRPDNLAAGRGGAQSWFFHTLMASPQCAMAQSGSL